MESVLGESVLVRLFIICASKKHASKNTQFNQLKAIFEKKMADFFVLILPLYSMYDQIRESNET